MVLDKDCADSGRSRGPATNEAGAAMGEVLLARYKNGDVESMMWWLY